MEAVKYAYSEDSFQQQFVQDVIRGLSKPQKQLPSKYFYDSQGSKLFYDICALKEYYPYRTEIAMLPKISEDMDSMLSQKHDIVEFGAGSLVKIRLLLNTTEKVNSYIPIDIASEHLAKASQILKREFNALPIHPVVADFTKPVSIPNHSNAPKMGFFPGSTIGNFTPDEAVQFLMNARQTLGSDSLLLIGVDLKKDPAILHRAYNDSEGVTAAFNQNILERINREIDGNFKTKRFDHYAYYNTQAGRIEMHLVSNKDQTIYIGNRPFELSEGESIHTENSHKYTVNEFELLAEQAHWRKLHTWLDDDRLFSVHLLRAA